MDVLIESTRLLGLFSETAANIWHLHSDQAPPKTATPQPSNPAPMYSQTAIRGQGHALSTLATMGIQGVPNYSWHSFNMTWHGIYGVGSEMCIYKV